MKQLCLWSILDAFLSPWKGRATVCMAWQLTMACTGGSAQVEKTLCETPRTVVWDLLQIYYLALQYTCNYVVSAYVVVPTDDLWCIGLVCASAASGRKCRLSPVRGSAHTSTLRLRLSTLCFYANACCGRVYCAFEQRRRIGHSWW